MKSSASVSSCLLVVFFLLAAKFGWFCSLATAQEAVLLTPAAPLSRTLAARQIEWLRLQAVAGQWSQLVFNARETALEIGLFAPAGQLLKVETGNSINLTFVAETSGEYRLRIRAAQAGSYEVRIAEVRAATPVERQLFRAERLNTQADELFEKRGTANYQQALLLYREALELFRATANRPREALTLKALGATYRLLNENQSALEMFMQTLPLLREQGNRREEAATLNNIAGIYLSRGETEPAITYYREALAVVQSSGDRQAQGIIHNNLGMLHHSRGETQQGIDSFQTALSLRRATQDRRGEATTLINLGVVMRDIGDDEAALRYFEQARPVLETIGDERLKAVLVNHLGVIYRAQGKASSALEQFEQARVIQQKLGDKLQHGAALTNLGATRMRLGEYEAARQNFEQALALLRASEERRAEGLVLRYLGELSLKTDDPAAARSWLEQALQIQRALGDPENESLTLGQLARVELRLGNQAQAVAQLENTLQLYEAQRAKVVSPELRAAYFAARRSDYELYVDLLLRQREQTAQAGERARLVRAAFEASEQARARALLDLLTESRVELRSGVDAGLLERERALRERLNTLETTRLRLVSSKTAAPQLAALQKELDQTLQSFQAVQTQLRARSPQYAALTQPARLEVKTVQQALDAGTVLLAFMLGAERSYVWAVTAESVAVYGLPSRAEIENLAREVYGLLTARNQRLPRATPAARLRRERAADAAYWTAAARLSQTVLGPAAAHLKRPRLAIIADGALQYLPFNALPAPAAKNGREPLIATHEVVFLPSCAALLELRRPPAGRPAPTKTVAVLADPVFQSDDLRVQDGSAQPAAGASSTLASAQLTRSAGQLGLDNFARLHFTRLEAEAIAQCAPAKETFAALDFDASRATLLTRLNLADFRILHFATHGLLNTQHPELSGLVLSLVTPQGEAQEGFLRLHEIYNLRLNAELVVLSGCQTALGKEIKGEGFIGLTRGFMYAGAPRVLASLWSVQDKATTQLMKAFYTNLLRINQPVSAALRLAQLEMHKQGKAPYFWAAFTLQGEWR